MWKICQTIGLLLVASAASPVFSAAPTKTEEPKAGVIEIQSAPVQIQVAPQPPNAEMKPLSGAAGSLATNPKEWSTYWLGVQCMPVPAALRAHLSLPEKQGLLIASVAAKSPAEKAGFARYDVLLRVGGKPIANPRDLTATVEAAKETSLKLDLIRGGKLKTIEVTPTKRPEPMYIGPETPDQADWETVQRWIDSMTPDNERGPGRQPLRLQFVQPGAIVPPKAGIAKPMPENLMIVISKSGEQPAKIEVTRDKEKWSLTEKELAKLPADIRPYVQRMLGTPVLSGIVNLGSGAFNFAPDVRIAPKQALPQGPQTPDEMRRQLEKQIQDMNRRMDELQKMLEGWQPEQQPPKEPMLEKKK